MIKNLGYEYTTKLTVEIEMVVTAHNEDEAGEEAIKIVEEALKNIKNVEVTVDSAERGDEALDITEDD